jgi:hypothetical protein
MRRRVAQEAAPHGGWAREDKVEIGRRKEKEKKVWSQACGAVCGMYSCPRDACI